MLPKSNIDYNNTFGAMIDLEKEFANASLRLKNSIELLENTIDGKLSKSQITKRPVKKSCDIDSSEVPDNKGDESLVNKKTTQEIKMSLGELKKLVG